MKKSFLFASLLSGLFLSALTLTACSSDDEEGASEVPAPTLTDADGNVVQVLSAGSVWFRYDENGRLSSFGDSYETYEVEGNSFTISNDEGYTANFTTNSNGLITKIALNCDLKAPDGSYDKENITISYRYNSEHQLTGASYSGGGEWNYEGERGSANGTGSITNTWKDGNLVTSVQEIRTSGKEGGESYSEKETGTYTFSYGDAVNPIKQFPYFVGDGTTGSEEFSLFCVVGMYGVGPSHLPTGYVEEWVEEGDSYDPETRSYTLSYTLNDNGTINTEYRGSYRLTYQYGAVRSVVDQAEDLLPVLKKQMDRMLKPKHRR